MNEMMAERIEIRVARLEKEVQALRESLARRLEVCEEHSLITRDPGVCGGEPIIRGTRTPVRAIKEHLRMGESVEEILEHLPYLTVEQIHAALEYYRHHKREIDELIELNNDEDFWRAWIESVVPYVAL